MAIKQYFIKQLPNLPRFTNQEALLIGPVLTSLAENGKVSSQALVEAARSTNSPLHGFFEWDDTRAAAAHRQAIADEMIRTVRVRIISSGKEEIGLAAHKVFAQVAPHKALVSVPTVPVVRDRHDPKEAADNARLTRRSLDPNYYPEDVDEACDIIDTLRTMLAEFKASEEAPILNMTKKENVIYRLLCTGRVYTKDAIYNALYGTGSDVEKKIIDVFVCKLRKKLPPGEIIETVWGVGYKFLRMEAPPDGA